MLSSAARTRACRQFVQVSPRDIPPLPGAMVELLDIANDPSVSFSALTHAISRDQALTLRMLTVANSSYYGCSRRVDTVRNAVAVLGTRQVQNIVAAMALAPAFEHGHGPALWQHGLTTAVWTKQVVRALAVPPLDYVFTAGLIHDVGVVILLDSALEAETECIERANADRRPLEEVEREALGTDHAYIGARACSTWGLPDRLTALVGEHHYMTDDDALDLRVLHAANALARICEDRLPGPSAAGWDATCCALERLDFDEDDILRLLELRADVVAEADTFG